MFLKGAPESVLARCTSMLLPDGQVVPFTEAEKRGAIGEVGDMAKSALRVLALAVKTDLGLLADYDGEMHPGEHHAVW